jgi:hypothetical protein
VGLAQALKVSLRTVDVMLADGEITPMRLRRKMVRFYLPDVLRELREKAKTSKRNCAKGLTAMDTDLTQGHKEARPYPNDIAAKNDIIWWSSVTTVR